MYLSFNLWSLTRSLKKKNANKKRKQKKNNKKRKEKTDISSLRIVHRRILLFVSLEILNFVSLGVMHCISMTDKLKNIFFLIKLIVLIYRISCQTLTAMQVLPRLTVKHHTAPPKESTVTWIAEIIVMNL